jgi:hypothetical protein
MHESKQSIQFSARHIPYPSTIYEVVGRRDVADPSKEEYITKINIVMEKNHSTLYIQNWIP